MSAFFYRCFWAGVMFVLGFKSGLVRADAGGFEDQRSYADICIDPNLSALRRSTVAKVNQALGISDCRQAEASVSSRGGRLRVLDLSSIRPLQALKGLYLLQVGMAQGHIPIGELDAFNEFPDLRALHIIDGYLAWREPVGFANAIEELIIEPSRVYDQAQSKLALSFNAGTKINLIRVKAKTPIKRFELVNADVVIGRLELAGTVKELVIDNVSELYELHLAPLIGNQKTLIRKLPKLRSPLASCEPGVEPDLCLIEP